MLTRSISALVLMSLLTACSPESENPAKAFDQPAEAPVSEPTTEVADSTCADDGPRFPISGLCVGRSVNYLDTPVSDTTGLAELAGATECAWQMMEVPIATDILLYQGLVCDDQASTLEFAGGAQSANLYLASSAFGVGGDLETPLVTIITSDPEAPNANLERWTRAAMDAPTESEQCSARPAGVDGWPEGALVVDIPEEAAALEQDDGPRFACGPFGLNQDSENYWRVFDGYAWFFSMGQEPNGIAPASFTLLVADGNGGWTRAVSP